MNKIIELFTAWGVSFNPNSEQLELASKRLEVCNSCEYKGENAIFKNVCGVCGCSLKAKVYSPVKGACPEKKWDEIDNQIIKHTDIKTLRFVSAQPAIIYYAWQIEVMLQNFLEMGVNLNQVDIVCWKVNGVIPAEWSKLAGSYPARFFFYDDTRVTKHYISSIRPNILKHHWKRYPELSEEAVFYHDCDIVFTRPIQEWITDDMLKGDEWYGSNTNSYISHSYIASKGEDILDKMCEITSMNKRVIIDNEENCIGAQYLMKNVTYSYWERVESDSEQLFKQITDINNIKKAESPEYHELQIWTADMWAVLWGAWRLGFETKVHPNFDFSWATSHVDRFNSCNIYHNAGAVTGKDGLFFKGDFINKLPYNEDIRVNENTISEKYWQIIQKTAKSSVLL